MTARTGYTFETNCVSANGDDINAMKATGTAISYRTFRKAITPEAYVEIVKALGYSLTAHRGNLTLQKDWHVAYYRGTYLGKPCVYLVWSAIEYIFT